ncbi:iron(III) transport system substrate-binding protein [Stella humosa]|uniref:Iron(III) transport system substrate-binding protein n=1 Tax=Stella humosa TaxID=94 RepID=A0A3N1LIS8_9PROT|nr:putative 2-aminoethylphosphonate ABC transporter substrate-binding protein [Stella humosa]ROP91190.1 iron(III) transport system substrate-binding protein [Stella humosa]BBK34458.1 putative 2-aminoethylphosphonate ABC transporter substrate-binding protein [Stella humosa]
MTRFGTGFVVALAAALAAGAASAKTQLTVYTALENEQLRPYKAAFEAANPDVEIVWVRDSTGVITARLLAEKANPKADVIMGVAVTSLILFENEGMIEPYAVRGADQLRPAFRDAKNPPAWIGMDAYMSAVCYNTVEGQKKNIPQPTSWADLLKPEYRGQIVMPNPASSGTGFLSVSGWLQSMGEAPGWKYMDGLHQNVAVYTHSGSAPCVQAARGEYVVGISFEYRAAQEKTKGAPISVILPTEGVGWDLEASAIHKGTKNLEAAKKLMDWTATKDANVLFNNYFGVVAYPGVNKEVANYPKDAEAKMIKNDFAFSAKNRDAILTEWTKRYDGKSAPKK